ncbi:dihydrolipoyl dehydrogenase family protein [Bosea sp. 685]|uniref:dihydrolipoyl dehydrogenase family protein n=1 Tax=Bosea sp. 685 TaxID=3080057 RepID=UPI002892D14D|nr:FAD-dependent oxidoreductase [Bosea sp. 685]WNJ89546.1 FAD-dependent oxidoreductase [Bosea sp. 685]
MSETTATAPKPAPLTPDICVIGAGAAGVSLATAAAAFGVPVVLVEPGGMGDGHQNAGSISARALGAAGARARAVQQAGRFGISAGEPQVNDELVNYARVHDHVQRVVAATARNDSAERLGALGIHVIKSEARFISRSTVMAGNQPIKARRFVIATGSRPSAPLLPGLDAVPFLTSESLFSLTRRPERLLVLGAGSTGVELAQAMARLGSTVSLVAAGDLLPHADPEAVLILRRALLRDGITLHEKARVLRAETVKGGVRLVLAGPDGEADQKLDGTHLLVATGRTPNIEALDLELAGITSDAGGVIVDKGLRTGNRRVFAIGDCASGAAGGLHSTHVAQDHAAHDQAGLVLRNALFRLPVRTNATAILRVTYCHPELASVGLSEAEARKRSSSITILRWPYAENDRAQAEHETDGFVKLVADRRGRVLGATIVGAGAGELIAPWCLAVRKGLTVQDMAGLALPYPTFSEASKRAAMSFYAPLAAKPGIRRLIGFLRRFG